MSRSRFRAYSQTKMATKADVSVAVGNRINHQVSIQIRGNNLEQIPVISLDSDDFLRMTTYTKERGYRSASYRILARSNEKIDVKWDEARNASVMITEIQGARVCMALRPFV